MKILITIFFIWTVYDRIKSTFNKKLISQAAGSKSEKCNSIFMIVLYVGIAVSGYVVFLKLPNSFSVTAIITIIIGSIIYLLSRYVRIKAITTLGLQWNVHTSADNFTRVINLGPYRYSRHPYYFATFFELVAYSMVFLALNSFLLSLLLFLPLIVVRTLSEEKKIKIKSPKAYGDYQKEVNYVFDIKNYFQDFSLIQDLRQILGITKRFGLKQLFNIVFMSNSIEKYSRGYAVSRIAGVLIEVGLIAEINKNGKINLIKFSDEHNYDLRTLKIICDYFSILDIFKKNNCVYEFTQYGKKLFSISQGVFTLLYAYMPIFESLTEIIKKEKEYGRDVFRKDKFVGKGSCELGELLPVPYAINILEKHNLNRILDMGCGSGDFLIRFCKDNNFVGHGIDLSIDSINIAKDQAEKAGLSSRVFFQKSDILNIDEYKNLIEEVDVLLSMFVLHEFLSEGRERVVEILKYIKNNFPNKYIFISEVYRRNVVDLIANPVPVAEHHLFHRLSQQGLANIKEWRSIFEESGLDIVEEKRFDRAAQVYFLLKSK